MCQFQVQVARVNARHRVGARGVPGEAAFFGEAEPLAALGAMVAGWWGWRVARRGACAGVVWRLCVVTVADFRAKTAVTARAQPSEIRHDNVPFCYWKLYGTALERDLAEFRWTWLKDPNRAPPENTAASRGTISSPSRAIVPPADTVATYRTASILCGVSDAYRKRLCFINSPDRLSYGDFMGALRWVNSPTKTSVSVFPPKHRVELRQNCGRIEADTNDVGGVGVWLGIRCHGEADAEAHADPHHASACDAQQRCIRVVTQLCCVACMEVRVCAIIHFGPFHAFRYPSMSGFCPARPGLSALKSYYSLKRKFCTGALEYNMPLQF